MEIAEHALHDKDANEVIFYLFFFKKKWRKLLLTHKFL